MNHIDKIIISKKPGVLGFDSVFNISDKPGCLRTYHVKIRVNTELNGEYFHLLSAMIKTNFNKSYMWKSRLRSPRETVKFERDLELLILKSYEDFVNIYPELVI